MSCDVKKQDQIWRFEIDRPNIGEMTVIDPLLDSEARARQRAESEFLENAYIANRFSFRTYRTDLELRDEIMIAGLWYKIMNMTFAKDEKKIVTTVSAKRYD